MTFHSLYLPPNIIFDNFSNTVWCKLGAWCMNNERRVMRIMCVGCHQPCNFFLFLRRTCVLDVHCTIGGWCPTCNNCLQIINCIHKYFRYKIPTICPIRNKYRYSNIARGCVWVRGIMCVLCAIMKLTIGYWPECPPVAHRVALWNVNMNWTCTNLLIWLK